MSNTDHNNFEIPATPTYQRRFIMATNLLKREAALALFLIAIIAPPVIVYGSGIAKELAGMVIGMLLGLLVFGFFIDPANLSEEGKKMAYGVRRDDADKTDIHQ